VLAAGLPLATAFLSAVFLRLFACAQSFEPQAQAAPLVDARLPVYTLIVPLYREARVALQLAQAIDRLDYPRAKLDVIFVVEQNDRATARALTRNGPRAPHQILIAPDGAPRTKPRAMNIAAPFARGALLAVFDAEDLPEPRQLRRAAALFARLPARVACLQASLCIDNGAHNWLTAHFALDYAALFDVFNKGLGAMGLPIFLGGTSNHFRIEALREVGLWDAYNVTEDADLGLRLARAGYIVKTFDSQTFEEAPLTFRALLDQRTRWLKGWMRLVMRREISFKPSVLLQSKHRLWLDVATLSQQSSLPEVALGVLIAIVLSLPAHHSPRRSRRQRAANPPICAAGPRRA
jgi:cellulose synthase/poly-beta-1,6-N-acetylglucosamine synthase-like glycosyltransferase